MKQFPSFGNESRDCSIRFDSVVSDQEGMWTCAARFKWQNYYTAAPSVQLSIFTGNLWTSLIFAEKAYDISGDGDKQHTFNHRYR
jgi:hypothetical protein